MKLSTNVSEIPSDADTTLSQILIGCSTLTQLVTYVFLKMNLFFGMLSE